MSRSRLAIWNYLSGLLSTGITLIGLVVTRAIVDWLGPERFGVSRMVIDWLAFLSIFETGLTTTLAPLLARAVGRNERDRLEKVVSAGLRSFLALVVLSVVLASGLYLAIDWLISVGKYDLGAPLLVGSGSIGPMIRSRLDAARDAVELRVAWWIGLIGLVPMILTPFRALADARQRGYRINLALAAQSLLVFGMSLAFGALGFGIPGQVAAVTLGTLPLAILLTRDGVRGFPGLLRAAILTKPDRQVCFEMVRLGVPMILVALCGRISLASDSLVVGQILGPALAARFFLSIRLTVLAQTQLQTIGNACWAALAELYNQGKIEEFNRRILEVTGLVSLLGMASLTPIVAYNKYFVALWLGPTIYLGDGLALLSSINSFLLGLTSLWFWCFTGTGQMKRMLPMLLGWTVVNVVVSIGATIAFGPVGPILGTTAGIVCSTLWYLPVSLRRVFGTSIRGLVVAAVRPLFVGIPFGLVLYRFTEGHTPAGWLGLAAEMSLAAFLYLGLAFVLVLGTRERQAWILRFRGAIGRRAGA